MHCGTTVAVHGILERHPWLEDAGTDEFRETVLDLALARADDQDPRWFECDKGGDWSGTDEVRELAWMRADIPEDVRHPRLPVLSMTRTLFDGLSRVGTVSLAALCAFLPLQVTAGDASDDLDDLREWFALGPPTTSIDVVVTVSAALSPSWNTPGEATRVRDALQTRLGTAAETRTARTVTAEHLARRGTSRRLLEETRPVVQFQVSVREWTPDASVWLIESTGDALRATGHTTPVVVTATRT
ncbi:hypothetical protein AB0C51_18265 [Streptomyces pathocidini]|uniref:hypothetical protein n=1 Tax=Streptomyces pathocidini TaxID=1650571 RepID=UPI0033C3DEB3